LSAGQGRFGPPRNPYRRRLPDTFRATAPRRPRHPAQPSPGFARPVPAAAGTGQPSPGLPRGGRGC